MLLLQLEQRGLGWPRAEFLHGLAEHERGRAVVAWQRAPQRRGVHEAEEMVEGPAALVADPATDSACMPLLLLLVLPRLAAWVWMEGWALGT